MKKPALFLLILIVVLSITIAVSLFSRQKQITKEFENFKFNGIFEYNNRQFANAVQQFVNALYLKPKDVEARILIVQAYKKSKSYNLAEEFLTDSFKVLPENPALLAELGYVYLDWGKLDEARSVFQKLVDARIDPLEGYDGLAEVEVISGNYDESVKLFSKTKPFRDMLINKRTQRTKVAKSFYRFASLMKRTGYPEIATTLFLRVQKLNPYDVEIYLDLAQLYEYVKKRKEAEDYYSKFLQMASPLYQEEIEFARQRLEALKRDEFLTPPPVIPLK